MQNIKIYLELRIQDYINIENIAIIDVFSMFFIAYLLTIYNICLIPIHSVHIFNNKFNNHIMINVVGLFILGIISHRLFCVRTTVDKLLF